MTFEIPQGNMEFTQELSDKYIGDVMPCWIKVREHRKRLTDKERQFLQEFLQDLLSKYARRTLLSYQAPRYASGALAIDRCIAVAEWEDGLEKKATYLRQELEDRRANNSITPEKEESYHTQIDDIHYRLDPSHFHRVS